MIRSNFVPMALSLPATTSRVRRRPSETDVMAAAQRPAALSTLGEPSGPPAWKTIPSWYEEP
jgi:hypothetical protein